MFLCGMCNKKFPNKRQLLAHRAAEHSLRTRFYSVQSAHERAVELFRLDFPDEIVTLDECMQFSYKKLKALIRHLLTEKPFMKVSFSMALRFSQSQDDPIGAEGSEVITMNLRSKTVTFTQATDISAEIRMMMMYIANTFDDFVENGSGWVLVDCLALDVNVAECASLNGSCPLHNVIYKDKGVHIVSTEARNVSKGRCFFHAIACHFLNGETRVEKLEEFIESELVVQISYPVNLKDIPKFEEDNKHLDLSVNVLWMDSKDEIYPLHPPSNPEAKNLVHLMMHYTNEASLLDMPVMHFAIIQNIHSVLARRCRSSQGNYYTQPTHYCFNCFSKFGRMSALQKHIQWCYQKDGQIVELPKEGEVVKYDKKHKEFKTGYIFFFDFETYQKTPEKVCSCPSKDKCSHKTKVVAEHKAFAFSFLMLSRDGTVVEDIQYVGEDAADVFVEMIIDMDKKYMTALANVKEMKLTREDEEAFAASQKCHICNECFEQDEPNKRKVRDHDHITGKYVGAAHNICNLHRKETMKLVGFAHNFSGYDSHLVVDALGRCKKRPRIEAIPLNTEKFKMIKIGHCTLMDSMSFLGASLEKLVETLKASKHNFPILSQWVRSTRKREKLLKKGVYPYEWVTDMSVLDSKNLPPREEFFSNLAMTHVNEEDYKHAVDVWNTFHCESFKQYTVLYCRADTYQLAEAVCELREGLLEEFGIDMCHFLSLPMMTKDIMLKSTNVKMGLLTDVEMVNLVKSNIRGGLSYVNMRHFDCEEEEKKRGEPVCVSYVDANNLYGAAMRFPMPLNDFRWMSEKEINAYDPLNFDEKDERGYFLEVTLDYPEHLHLDHSSFPLAPHQMEVTDDLLSEYATEALKRLKNSTKYKAIKLTSTFLRRENYLVHALNLKLYLELGMKLVTIHRGISFYQEQFLRPYIDMCTKKRAAASTKTRSNMMKLLSNSLYGKVSEFIYK